MKKIQISILLGSFILIPALVFAQDKTLSYLITKIVGYFNQILGLLMGLALIMFVWYVIQYFVKPTDKRSEGAMYVMYSLIGFFVILSFWGLVNILQNTFDIGNDRYAPRDWNSFTNLFPGGGSSSGGQQNTYTEAELDLLRGTQIDTGRPDFQGSPRIIEDNLPDLDG